MITHVPLMRPSAGCLIIAAAMVMIGCGDDETSGAPGPWVDTPDGGGLLGQDIQNPETRGSADMARADLLPEITDTSASPDTISDSTSDDAVLPPNDGSFETAQNDVSPGQPAEDALAETDSSPGDASPSLADGSDTTDVDVPEVAGPVDVLPPEPDLPETDADEPDGPPPAPTDLYLLSVDNSSHTLQKVDVATGATTDVCQLNTTQTYPSLTFSRFNGLYGSRDGKQLDQIDPCTCTISPIGSYAAYSGMYGITADQADNLFGIATVQDWLVSISTDNGVGTGLGSLGLDFTTSGGTWSDADDTLFAINGGTNGLYTVDPILGTATLLSSLNYEFGTVGIELHPGNGVIYACSSAGHLLSVDPNGQVTNIGDMGQGGSCTNLAAPWLQVPCLDGL